MLFLSVQVNCQILRQVIAEGEVGKVDDQITYFEKSTQYSILFNTRGKEIIVSRNNHIGEKYVLESEADILESMTMAIKSYS